MWGDKYHQGVPTDRHAKWIVGGRKFFNPTSAIGAAIAGVMGASMLRTPFYQGVPLTSSAPEANDQVQTFGPPSAYAFGNSYSDTLTPTGQSFGAFPSQWPVLPGAGLWFSAALPGGDLVSGAMSLTDNEAKPTALGTGIYIWDNTLRQLVRVDVPTTTGELNPPGPNGATGSTIDQVTPVTISGVQYIFAIGAESYAGWQISKWGDAYWLMAFKKTASGWIFDATHSKTAAQLAASSSAGASAFPTTTNGFGETVHESLGPVCMGLAPNSQHLLIGNYFFKSGLNSGSILAVNPSTGAVTSFFQVPDVTATNSVPTTFSVRDLIMNPTSGAGDERMIVTYDVFIRKVGATGSMGTPGPPTTGAHVAGNTVQDSNGVVWYCIAAGTPGTWQQGPNFGTVPLMEFSYNGSSTITQKSSPVSAYTMPNTPYEINYNIVGYDGSGNLLCPTNGGTGLGVFHGREAHLFLASGANLPTFEAGGASSWVFPTFSKSDFRYGGFNLPNGFSCSVNYYSTDDLLTLLTNGGQVIGMDLPGSMVLGPELVTNGDLSSSTITAYNGFFNSTLARVADSDFSSGFCLELTSTSGTQNVVSQALIPVTPFANYQLTCKIKGVTLPEAVDAELWWHDANNNLITQDQGEKVTMQSNGVITIEAFADAPPNAVTGFMLINIAAQSIGEKYRVGDFSWKAVPGTMTALVDTNRTRLVSSTAGDVFCNKGPIIDGRLWFTVLDLDPTYPGDVGEILPQWLTSVDLSALTSPATATAPGAPTLTQALSQDSGVNLIWTDSSITGGSPVTGHTIWRSTSTGTEIPLITVSASSRSYIDTTAVNGTTYFYKIQTNNAVSGSVLSNERSQTPAAVLPSAAVLAVTPGNTQNQLDWNFPTAGAPFTAVKVYSGASSPPTTLLTTLGNVLTFTDTGLTNGTPVFYGVEYVNAHGTGPMSNIVSGTPTGTGKTAPPAPSGLSDTVSGTSVTLNWTDNGTLGGNNETDGVDYYVDHAKIGYEGYPSPAPTSHVFDLSAYATGSHTVGVVAWNGGGDSTESYVTVTITAPPPPPPGSLIKGIFSYGGLSGDESFANSLGFTLQGYSDYTAGNLGWPGISGYRPPSLPAGCRLLLGINMIPDGNDLTALSGNLGNFTTLARNLPNGTICRIGWEWGGNWYSWGRGVGANTPALYASSFQQIVTTMRAVNNTFLFDWCDNTGSSTPAQLAAAYPGDAYVDLIGGDHYDNADGSPSGDWSVLLNYVNFAVAHGKKVSVAEFGLKGSPGPGGNYDDPNFIKLAAEFGLNPAAATARYGFNKDGSGNPYVPYYMSYFEAWPGGGFDSLLTDAGNSFAAFKANF